MKVKSKSSNRRESLLVKVLRKTVSEQYFQQRRNIINLSSSDEAKKLIAELTKESKNESEQNVPKTPVKSNGRKDESKSSRAFNCKMIAANFARKFGIERKLIEPANMKKENPTGMKSGKGGKLIYV